MEAICMLQGLTLKIEHVQKLADRFEEIVRNTITPDLMIPQIEIDAELNFKDITPKLFRIIRQFEPFGPENSNPVFFAENVSDNGYARLVGSEDVHLQLGLIQEDSPFNNYRAIAFNQASYLSKIRNGAAFDIAYTLVENSFRGNTTIQLNIKDIKIENR